MGKMFFPDDYISDGKQNTSNVHMSGRIENIWVEKNCKQYETSGIKIHVNLTLINVDKKRVEVSAYFYNSYGNPLKDANKAYCTSDGQVAAALYLNPQTSYAWYNNCELFIPNHELHLVFAQSVFVQIIVWVGNESLIISDRTSFYFSPYGQ